MESLKKLLKTDQFKEISINNEILKGIRLNLIKMIGDKQSKLTIRDNSLFITFSKNSFLIILNLLAKEFLLNDMKSELSRIVSFDCLSPIIFMRLNRIPFKISLLLDISLN
jgi:membrane protein CcdC involved in cytochrome C biogenesis